MGKVLVHAVIGLLLCCGSPASAAPAAAARDAMAAAMGEAMLRMMETMGLLGQGGLPPVPLTAPLPPPAAGAWEAMTRMPSTPAGEGNAQPPADGALDGFWEGGDGTLLIVQGDGFRLYATLAEHLDGELRIAGDRLILTNRRENFSQTFEYALDQDRLALRDANGQVYLYRRPRLDGGDAP